jgi:hypothetical protein
MTTRSKPRREYEHVDATRADKNFEDVAERVFRDDSPGEPLYGDILDEAAEEAA